MNSLDRIVGNDLPTAPDWSATCDGLKTSTSSCKELSRAELGAVVEILQKEGRWQTACRFGQFDNETKVRHLRPDDVVRWQLATALQIIGSEIYVLGKGGHSERIGEGAQKRVCRCVRLSDLKTVVQGTVKLRDLYSKKNVLLLTEREVRANLAQELAVQSLFTGCERFVQILHTCIYSAKIEKGEYEKMAITMEDCPGGDLFTFLRDDQHPLQPLLQKSAQNVILIVRDALLILCEMEKKQVLHRDIKQENLLLVSPDGETLRLKQCDFGYANTVAAERTRLLTTIGPPPGTVEYACPDVSWRAPLPDRTDTALDAMCDFKTNVWSMGVVLYDMLAGDLPNYGPDPTQKDSFTQMELDVGFESWSDPNIAVIPCLPKHPDLNHFLHELVGNMVVLDPAKRKQGSELIVMLDEYLVNNPLT